MQWLVEQHLEGHTAAIEIPTPPTAPVHNVSVTAAPGGRFHTAVGPHGSLYVAAGDNLLRMPAD